jgi:hypothetical protein
LGWKLSRSEQRIYLKPYYSSGISGERASENAIIGLRKSNRLYVVWGAHGNLTRGPKLKAFMADY